MTQPLIQTPKVLKDTIDDEDVMEMHYHLTNIIIGTHIAFEIPGQDMRYAHYLFEHIEQDAKKALKVIKS